VGKVGPEKRKKPKYTMLAESKILTMEIGK